MAIGALAVLSRLSGSADAFLQGITDIEEGAAIGFANKTQGQVQLFWCCPAAVGQALAECGQLILGSPRWIKGNKEPFFHIPEELARRLSRPGRPFIPVHANIAGRG